MIHTQATLKTGRISPRNKQSVRLASIFAVCVISVCISCGALAGTAPVMASSNLLGADNPYWVERTIPGAASAIKAIQVAEGDPQALSVAVTGSSLLYSSVNGGIDWLAYASVAAQPFVALSGSLGTFYSLDAASRVYRSTNSGVAWAPVSLFGGPTSDLDTGTDASTLVMATGGPGSDLPPAFSSDYGATWIAGTGPAANWGIAAGDPTGWNVFYAARSSTTDTPLARSGDGGLSWVDCSVFPTPVHATGTVVLPNGGPLLVGTDTIGADPIWRSNDGGAIWTPSSSGIPAGETVLSLCASPTPTVYATTDKAVYASYDSGTTWSDISSNLPEKQYTAVCASGGPANSIFVGAADGTMYKASAPYVSNISPMSGSPGDTITVNGLSFGAGGADSRVVFGGVEATSYVSWADTRIKVQVPDLAMSGYLDVVTPQGSSNAVKFTRTTPEPSSYSWYLAEGCTGSDARGGFETWILVQNPGAVSADVTVTFMTDEGSKPGPALNVPPDSRTTVSVAEYVPDTWSVSTRLTSSLPVIAERSVYWNAKYCFRQAATDSIGITTPAAGWYLAEGCTGIGKDGTFETWILVQNPSNQSADVSLTYMTTEGPVPGPSFSLPAYSRKSIDVAETLPNCWSVSTSVTSNVPVVAERSMYLDTPKAFRQAATDSIGVEAGATTWYLAEGCTGGNGLGSFETWVLVQNPGIQQANVQVTYMTPTGPVNGPKLTLPAMSRQTVNVAESVPGGWDVSTKIASDQPVIAERAIYWSTPQCQRQAATDSIGVTQPQTSWCLAEGCTGVNGQGSFETWVLVQNPGSTSATIHVSYMTGDGRVVGPTLTVEPNTRRSINVAEVIEGGWNVSTEVTSDQPVIVERAMYWNATGVLRQAAHDSIGVAL